MCFFLFRAIFLFFFLLVFWVFFCSLVNYSTSIPNKLANLISNLLEFVFTDQKQLGLFVAHHILIARKEVSQPDIAYQLHQRRMKTKVTGAISILAKKTKQKQKPKKKPKQKQEQNQIKLNKILILFRRNQNKFLLYRVKYKLL